MNERATRPTGSIDPDAVRAWFASLVDDAAIFPPGNAPMAEAVHAHDRHRSAWYRDIVGPLLCSAGRVGELAATLGSGGTRDAPLPIVLVVPGTGAIADAVEALAAVPGATLAGVELAPVYGDEPAAEANTALDALASSVAGDVPVALEVARGRACEVVLDALAARRGAGGDVRAKLRTGGLTADAFPDELEVARFVVGCASRGIAFKCTAGLHHALRHTAPSTGFEHHGYLNVALAAGAAGAGRPVTDVTRVLAERDADAVLGRLATADAASAGRARELFASFGTCSVIEPLEDAVALGLLHPP